MLISLWVHWLSVQVQGRLTNIWAQMHSTGRFLQKICVQFHVKLAKRKKKNHKTGEPGQQQHNQQKQKQQQRADLKTKKEKYQAEQNSCAACNTGVFCFRAESPFQKSKIR